jgi:2-polyprenyl-6-methoxyphenol hydroxylase-like FAD-dependent oxidoreductase
MTEVSSAKGNILVVGAGPTGLTVAMTLLAAGREVTIVDDHPEGNNESRAAVIYPGTLEVLHPFGVAERLASKGIHTPRFTIRDRDKILLDVVLRELHTRYPYALLVSQAVTESVLLDRVKQLGGEILRPRKLTNLDQDESGVTATFNNGERIRAAFVAGADGAHSVVRDQAGLSFDGNSEGASYALADVHLTGGVPDDELVVYFSPAGHLVVLPLPGGVHRIVVNVDKAPEHPDVSFLQQLVDARGPSAERAVIHDIVWGSRFLTHHALVERYHTGRILLAGDAAHVHSPLGGQGMNLGIIDAVALGQAMIKTLGSGERHAMDAYDAARRPVAKRVIAETDFLTKLATMPASLRTIRNLAVTAVRPIIRKRLAWNLSMLGNRSGVQRDGSGE